MIDFQSNLEKIEQKLQDYDKIVFIIAGDGKPGYLELHYLSAGEKLIRLVNLDSFLQPIKNAFQEKLVCVQLAACECMKDGSLNQILEKLEIAAVGYTKQVDWSESASVDLHFLMKITEDQGDVATAYKLVKNGMDGLVRQTGFVMFNPKIVNRKSANKGSKKPK